MRYGYKILNKQEFHQGNYSLVPIRMKDRYDIMKWRNDQMYHLRQSSPLTMNDQDNYFNSIVKRLFETDNPNQILFSYLDGDKCIGYGGLVHINWTDKNAEISFIIDTTLVKDELAFHWSNYLSFIEIIAFSEIKLHKIYTYAFDLRPEIYSILENNNYNKEAVLKEHCYFEGNYIDVVIHCKVNDNKNNSLKYEIS